MNGNFMVIIIITNPLSVKNINNTLIMGFTTDIYSNNLFNKKENAYLLDGSCSAYQMEKLEDNYY